MIAALADLHFVRPQWLWALLPLLPASLWWWRRQRRRAAAWQQRVDPHLLPHLIAPGSGRRGRARVVLGPALAALAVLALAGPGWRHQPQPLWQEAAPLVIALDLSSATVAEDLPPSRLLQARVAIDRLLQQRGGGQVALVAFAGSAHTVTPLTDDVGNAQVFLDALAPDIMPADGSRPDRAIAWSSQLLRQAGFEDGDILLLTHDADAAARREAAAAVRNGYAVSVLGLGTAQGAVHRDARGRMARTRMDEQALRALADAGSGGFLALAAKPGDAALAGLFQRSAAGAGREGTETARADQGYWLLLPLMLLAALAFRRGHVLASLVLAVALWLPLAPAQARDLWQRPDQRQHQQALAAVEAYRRGDFAAAERLWAELPGPDAAYNRGNALARAGRLQEALQAYDQALAQAPGMEDAEANRKVVEEALRRQPPEGANGAPPENGDRRDGDEREATDPVPQHRGGDADPSEQDPGSAEGRPEPDADGQDQESQLDQAPEAPPEPPQPADGDRQRLADEALREQMQEALETGQQDGQAAAPADIRERERREAAEAWLRRIPDDPGGLLRARFRLEHERRQREGAH